MGIDLRLLPVEHMNEDPDGAPWGYSHTVLDVPCNRDAWTAIADLPVSRVPGTANITSFCGRRVPDGSAQGEVMYGRMRGDDAYGEPYTWARVSVLRPVFERYLRGAPVTAYLNALEDDVMVILDWH